MVDKNKTWQTANEIENHVSSILLTSEIRREQNELNIQK